jgi:hypothetical protein
VRRTTVAKNKIKKKVIRDMHAEMNSSGMKDMWAMTALNPQMPNAQKLRILSKEIGDVAERVSDIDIELSQRMAHMSAALGRVAKSITNDQADYAEVYRQLIQVMTMAGAWAQSMRSARQPVSKAITT